MFVYKKKKLSSISETKNDITVASSKLRPAKELKIVWKSEQ